MSLPGVNYNIHAIPKILEFLSLFLLYIPSDNYLNMQHEIFFLPETRHALAFDQSGRLLHEVRTGGVVSGIGQSRQRPRRQMLLALVRFKAALGRILFLILNKNSEIFGIQIKEGNVK